MSPLPSPEERRKQLKILGLEPSKRTNVTPLPGYKSAASEERAQQRKEGQRRSRQAPRP
jgi:hypothetical protein